MAEISVYETIGKGYEDVWFTNCHARYRALKGGRNTKKSSDIAGVEPIIKILSSTHRNIIMCRQNDVDNGDSTFSNLVFWINQLGVGHMFSIKTCPYRITRKDTGQVIVFRGCNNPTSVTSVKPVTGLYTDVYFEEASELKSYEDFRKIDGSIRGACPLGCFLQITFLFNAWDIGHWLYDLFFKGRLEDNERELEERGYQFKYDPDFNLGFGKGLALHISSYKINEFRTSEYDAAMSDLREKAWELYRVEGLGCWGNTADAVYTCWNDELIKPRFVVNNYAYDMVTIGIDTGLSDGEGKAKRGDEVSSAMAMELLGVTSNYGKIVAIDEYYHSNVGARVKKTEPEYQDEMTDVIARWINEYPFMHGYACVYVDCADLGFRQGLALMCKRKGLLNVSFQPSTKLRIHNRISFENHLMAFGEVEFSEACKDLTREIKACHKGVHNEPRADVNDHAINAHEYAWAPVAARLRRWKTFKEVKV